jgi:NitT/TauT family transport system substrate-binding protein
VSTESRGTVVSTNRTSRSVLAVLACLLLAALGACNSAGPSGGDGKNITLGISATAPGGNTLQLGIAEVKNYFKDEGITVKPVFLGTGGKVVQALASGEVQIGMSTPDLVLQATDKGQDVKMFYNWTFRNVSQFGVLPDSDVRSVANLKGRTVGVQDLSAGPAQLAKAAATNAGLDPDTDIKWVAVGVGAPALDALQRHRVDALTTYDTLFAAMTSGTGKELRYFQPDGVADMFASSFVASGAWLKEHKDAAAGFGRAWAKASVYANENPEDGIRMMFDKYPNSKVGADTQAATKAARSQFDARQQSLYEDGKPPETQVWGEYPADAVEKWVTYAKDYGLTKEKLDPKSVYTNEFVKQFNDFDAGKIKQAAAGQS